MIAAAVEARTWLEADLAGQSPLPLSRPVEPVPDRLGVGVGGVMSVVGAAVVLARDHRRDAADMRVARASVVVVCVLFGLVLGASPIGDGVNAALAVLGGWAADRIREL